MPYEFGPNKMVDTNRRPALPFNAGRQGRIQKHSYQD